MDGKGRSAYWQSPGVLRGAALTNAIPVRGVPQGSLTVTAGRALPGGGGSVRGPDPVPQLIPGGVLASRAAVSRGYGSQPFQGKRLLGSLLSQSTSQVGQA